MWWCEGVRVCGGVRGDGSACGSKHRLTISLKLCTKDQLL